MSARRSLQHPTERDNQETELVSELHTRGKALELFGLLEVCMSPVVLRCFGVVLHLQCGFHDQKNGTFCSGYVIGQECSCAPLSRSKYSAPTCFPVDTELIVTPMIHGSTFEANESSPIELGVCEGYDTVHAAIDAVSEG